MVRVHFGPPLRRSSPCAGRIELKVQCLAASRLFLSNWNPLRWAFNWYKIRKSGGLAQLGERLPCKQEVSGSIPLISTTSYKGWLKSHGDMRFHWIFIDSGSIQSPAKRVWMEEEKQRHSRAFDAWIKCVSCGFDFDDMYLENWTLWIMMQLWEGNSKG